MIGAVNSRRRNELAAGINESEVTMDRLQLLEKAVRFAHEQVDGASCLTDRHYAELQNLEEEKAISALAKEILENATYDTD